MGDAGIGIYWSSLSVYLLFYYTDVLRIDPVTAGLIFGISIFWDAVTDPVMGIIATRTNTRWGKFRPYLVFGAPVLAICFVMMFAAPVLFPSAIVLSSAIAHIVFRTAYTVVSIPYSSLSAVITTSSEGRTRLAGARMGFAIIGTLLATITMPTLAAQFGGDNEQLGWAIVSCIYAVIGTVIILLCFRFTSEDAETFTVKAKVSLKDTVSFARSNTALWILSAAVILGSVGTGISSKSIVYFIKYNLDAEASTGALLGLQGLCFGASIPFWIWFGAKSSKRNSMMLGGLIMLSNQTFFYLSSPSTVVETLPYFVLNGVSFGSFAVMFWAMLPDTVEYGQWKSGIRDEGASVSLISFAQKAGVATAVALVGYLLEYIGYDPDTETPETLFGGLKTMTFLLPGLITASTAMIIWFYPIDQKKHAQILNDLEARHSASVGTG